MCFGCTKAASPVRTGFRGFVIWEAGSKSHDLPGCLCLLLVRAKSTVLSSVPKHPLSYHQTAFLCEMENGIFQGIWCRKTMNGPCKSLPAFIPAWCLSQWGTAGICTLHMRPWCTRSCSAFSQEPFSYWVVLCDICKPFWHRMAFAKQLWCGVFLQCIVRDIASWALRHELWCLLQIPWNVNISVQLPLRNLLWRGKKGE